MWGYRVRKRRAPKGALRHAGEDIAIAIGGAVRKHRAPKGALRQRKHGLRRDHRNGQKAPSAKGYIKTELSAPIVDHLTQVRKRRAPKGALRRL